MSKLAPGGGLEANLTKRGVGAEEHEVDAVVAGGFHPVAHLLGPILVVSERQERFVCEQALGMPVSIHIRRVCDVEAE